MEAMVLSNKRSEPFRTENGAANTWLPPRGAPFAFSYNTKDRASSGEFGRLMDHLSVKDLHKTYGDSKSPTLALRGVTFALAKGEFVALRGPSGCGKSTLLHIAGAMDRPTSGEVWLNQRRLDVLDLEGLAIVRRRHIGFVFQSFNLLPTLSALENVALPLSLDGLKESTAKARAAAALEEVGLSERARHLPSQLSGGEMQRVAIARAVAVQPELLIADEPTGSLDSNNGLRVLELLARLNATHGLTVLLATHSAEAAAFASRRVDMLDGRLHPAAELT